MPETADSDFLWREFKVKTDQLANVFGNFAVRVLKFVHAHFDGKVPAPTDHVDRARCGRDDRGFA